MPSSSSFSSRALLTGAFLLGLFAIAWVGVGFVGTASWLALGMTVAIAVAYLVGAQEIHRFRGASTGLAHALAHIPQPLGSLAEWLARVPAPLQNAVRQRVESGRGALPGLALTPYLIGLLVMLGMLGTFLGMVVTFKGAVFALEGSADLGAIRGALAAPIKGLGISFGTSVAGVASSAMLGLMSAIARRERLDVARALEQHTAGALRPFTAAFIAAENRDHTFAALQRQADALPQVVTQLQALMEQVERRHQQLDQQLSARQDQFHREAAAAYTGLGQSVAQALSESLSSSARMAGESIQPVVENAMAAIAQESTRLHERVSAAVQTQLTGLSTQFAATTGSVAEGWASALQNHARTSEQLVSGLGQALAEFNTSFETRAAQLLANVQQATAQQHSEQAQAEALKQAAWTAALQGMASGLQAEWQQVGEHHLAQQQAVCQTLEQTANAIQHSAIEQATRSMDSVARLLAQSEALVLARTEAEALWTQQHGQRMDDLAALWRSELSALRTDESTHLQTLRSEEAARGQAAVQRLGELQVAVTEHLATLGTSLEAPMSRLLETASEAPKAAAEVIGQLRGEMSRLTERDNLALQERSELVAHISSLLQNVQQTTGEQRAAIESLVASATTVLNQTGAQFAQTLGAQAGRADEQTAQMATSAAELAALGQAFQQGVERFSSTNEKLVDGLQRVEGAIGQHMARSDEQLAYYVAQAREVIDLSISAQQGIVEDMRLLRANKPAVAKAAPAAPAVQGAA
ncbi:MAG: hypothetical protein A2W72_04065 [Burkholderiales bacterium RIFCSPLOWO2_12_67_14]|nr:MAG: hypothetical protein A3I64_14480 [Burkholderiales bacterium RIFCSPLOWO2_02_FULL_67_64]OGB41610.1 MAG: hypothetical protein A2W72_04065 [Burkholderiales bacterium RIFCSPLOWO2_12_67_14]OGB45276.1 MAG: hypothetical protein A3E51_22005 [Burkholderiales bacterium RIFCSPHIGHO2_12_FULL_67_38]OGB75428.1 MAG: hypothetical protein A3G82_18360 [Burkholderiales bacterium RIFCSPLOWO2_12_FULL_67_210]